jgi:hypothetical protein
MTLTVTVPAACLAFNRFLFPLVCLLQFGRDCAQGAFQVQIISEWERKSGNKNASEILGGICVYVESC